MASSGRTRDERPDATQRRRPQVLAREETITETSAVSSYRPGAARRWFHRASRSAFSLLRAQPQERVFPANRSPLFASESAPHAQRHAHLAWPLALVSGPTTTSSPKTLPARSVLGRPAIETLSKRKRFGFHFHCFSPGRVPPPTITWCGPQTGCDHRKKGFGVPISISRIPLRDGRALRKPHSVAILPALRVGSLHFS